MEVLVVGGTGTVGSEVVRQLLERGEVVRVLARGADRAREQLGGARPVAGDLEAPETLREPFTGVEAVFLLIALGPRETEQGLAGVRAARDAGVGHIVYMSVAMPEDSKHIPHFASKVPIEQAIWDSGMPWTILRPNSFYQNDLRMRDAIVNQGVYAQPIGNRGMNRVDVRDVAEAAVHALTGGGYAGQEVPVHGPDVHTGEMTAEIYSRHLGREVRYAGDDLDAWERRSRATMPDWMVHDLRIMYEYFQKNGFRASKADLAREETILGHPPRSLDSFVGEVAADWKRDLPE